MSFLTVSGEKENDLQALIKARQQDREKQLGSFFDQLEAKYATKKPKKSIAKTSRTMSKKSASGRKAKGKN